MSVPASHPAPPFDAELAVTLAALADLLPPTLTAEMIPALRAGTPVDVSPDVLLDEAGVSRRDVTIPGHQGDEILVSVLQRRDREAGTPAPCVYHTHGGGMIIGDRFVGLTPAAPVDRRAGCRGGHR